MSDFPKAMYLPDGRDVTVADQGQQDLMTSLGAVLQAPGQAFPKLMWSPEGVEVTVGSQEAQDEKAGEGYTLVAPGTPVATEPAHVDEDIAPAASDESDGDQPRRRGRR